MKKGSGLGFGFPQFLVQAVVKTLALAPLAALGACGGVEITDLGGSMECDGGFLRDIEVENQTSGELQITLSIRDLKGVEPGLRVVNDKATIAADRRATYQLAGSLSDPCTEGTLTLVATDGSGTNRRSQPISIPPVPLKGTAPEGVTPGSSPGDQPTAFQYQVMLECCGAGGKLGTGFGPSNGNVDVRSVPTGSVSCSPPQGLLYKINGTLQNPNNSGSVDFAALNTDSGAQCHLITLVEAAQ